MPLNIDWQQILLHLFNFVILTGGLYLLLYKPVKDFMEKRNAHFVSIEKDAEEKLREAESVKAEYEEKLLNVEEEIKLQKAQALQEAETIMEAQIKEAKDEAKKIIKTAKEEAKHEHEKIVKSAQNDITKLAVAATEKLLNEATEDAYDRFISVTQEDDDDE